MTQQQVAGQVVNTQNAGIANLQVEAYDTGSLFGDVLLNSAITNANGNFSFTYDDQATDGSTPLPPADISIRIFTSVRRLLKEYRLSDLPPVVQLDTGYVTNWRVTGADGQVKAFSTGNSVDFLVADERAWSKLTDAAQGAQVSFDLLQLEFDLPEPKDAGNPLKARLITKFDPTAPLDKDHKRKIQSGDLRLEEVIAKLPPAVKPRILICVPQLLDMTTLPLLPLVIVIAILEIIPPISILAQYLLGLLDNEAPVEAYFKQVNAANITVRAFAVSEYARVHAKLAIVDGTKAFVLGSPFSQGYFDPTQIVLEEPRRGGESNYGPIQDVSLAVQGPVVANVYEAFRIHWNKELATGEQPLPSLQPPAAQPDNLPVQVVRTLTGIGVNHFGDGEMDILDAYLRAIEFATSFIYLENQYFTNKTIAAALAHAVKDRGVLLIVLLNFDPDVPPYVSWQARRIEELFKAVGQDKWAKIGFFTRWTHEAPQAPETKAPIIRNYIHSKVGIVDDKWATVGSANLDGNSLDTAQILQLVHSDKVRNSEVNCSLFSGVDNLPTLNPNPIANLRQSLWGMHLGLDPQTLSTPPAGYSDWADLWSKTAEDKRVGLKSAPAAPKSAAILPYPIKDGKVTYDGADSQKHLGKLEADIAKLLIGKKVRGFSFENGDWNSEMKHY